jgi:hypothetical protein
MLALIYLATMIVLGAFVCRRFYLFSSWLHYLAASFFVGLVLSTWATYLFALVFAWSDKPLLGANILFFALAALVIYKLRPHSGLAPELLPCRPRGSATWDAFFIGCFFLASCYLMFGTLWLSNGDVRMAFVVWNDFGPNLSLVQSFSIGHNFPTQYPHFIGRPIHYHFLFWFQAGNLEFLGLNMAWAVNLLSVLSLIAMLILIMTLGEALFNSRAVGRIGASLFFFPTTLSYVLFLRSQGSFTRALDAVKHLKHWLSSGYPYRGEDWGIWSLGVYYVQRHLIVGTGVLLLVLIFLVLSYQAIPSKEIAKAASTDTGVPDPNIPWENSSQPPPNSLSQGESLRAAGGESTAFPVATSRPWVPAFIFSGVLLGLLPMWNSAVFIAAFVVLAALFILCPMRPQMLTLAVTAGIVALPQLGYLSTDGARIPLKELFHWGFTLPDPTLSSVAKYLGFTFGFKWLLITVALFFAARLQRRIFVAVSGLILVAFLFRFSSVEILINHKFLNTWVTITNLFCAYGLWWIWKARFIGKVATVALVIAVSLGGTIEWFRIHNDTIVDVPFRPNALSKWLQANTNPKDVFLSDRFILHPILLNGRRIFYGWPYFAWSAGYPAHDRDVRYEQMFTEKNLDKLVQLLNQNGIRFIAIDNGVRFGFLRGRLNESVYRRYFKTVFEDKENRFGALVIYRVPDHVGGDTRWTGQAKRGNG